MGGDVKAGAQDLLRRADDCVRQNTAASLAAAIRSCDEAIALLGGRRAAGNPSTRHPLGIAWMTRGNASMQLGGPARLGAAIRCYDQAIAFLGELPVEADGEWLADLGAAWTNRGRALQREGAAYGPSEAVHCCDQAIALFRRLPIGASRRFRHNLAAAWINRAESLLGASPPLASEAVDSAREAMALVAEAEADDPFAGEIGLKARCALARALESRLAAGGSSGRHAAALIAAATDAAERGLELALSWRRRGADQFHPLAAWFFEFGARIYGSYQPHFLAEFILEALEPTFHSIAAEALTRALSRLRSPRLLMAGTAEADRLVGTWRELKIARERLEHVTHAQFEERLGRQLVAGEVLVNG
jgi:hypothetical protein